MNVLARVMRGAWREANKQATYVKVDEFERYVREKLFTSEAYDLLNKTRDYVYNDDDYLAYSKALDFRFKCKSNGFEFYVEAKFRPKYHDDGLELCKSFQLKRYQEIDNTVPVLAVIGLGGRSNEPEKVFLVPIKHIRFTKLHPSFLQRYEIHPNHSVSASLLKSIL
jgi:hypothetical protein